MSITWSNDANLDRICLDINKYISNYRMRNYYIYGLQQDNRPHVAVAPYASPLLIDLFKRSNYTLEVKEKALRYCDNCDTSHSLGDCCCDSKCGLCDRRNITIGLRRDVRSSPAIARKLVKTIIFSLEGKLVAPPTVKLNLGRHVRKVSFIPKKASASAATSPNKLTSKELASLNRALSAADL